MRYISLKNTSLTYFNCPGELSELSGSSKYNVYDSNIELKPAPKIRDIENTTATTDYLKSIIDTNTEHAVIVRLKENFNKCLDICILAAFNDIPERAQLDLMNETIKLITYCGEKIAVELKHHASFELNKKSNYFKQPAEKKTENKINKSKVKGKMFALFNLKCSKKFIAFYSVSFPINTSDNEAFVCWNYWLTCLRKKFDLSNYIWVSERQKNGILHFHMLTNNYLPILQINRALAIIINNRVKDGKMSWGNSSLDLYNGVDVDSIYNSKRHKKTGKSLNPAEIRNWISKYVTKYVTKNNDSFAHLCWHCSRSISILFMSQVFLESESYQVTSHLPTIRNLYINYKDKFLDCWVFCFVPPDHLFVKLKYYNDLIFEEFTPAKRKHISIINYKTTTL